jgi:hypothetical protein
MKKSLIAIFVAAFLLGVPTSALGLNARGQVAAGVGTAPVSVDKQIFDTGGGAQWLDADRIAYQHLGSDGAYVAIYDTRTGQIGKAADRGGNTVVAGGGVWGAWLAGFGSFASTGFASSSAVIAAVGPDGAIAYIPDYTGVGVRVREQSGDEWVLTSAVAYDVQLLGQRRAIWREGFDIKTAGIADPAQLAGGVWRPRAVFAAGEWWVSYYADAVSGLALHPFASTRGYVVATGDAFGQDIVALNGGIREAWAIHEGEHPEDIRIADVDLSDPRRELGKPTEPTPPGNPDPVVTPPVEPQELGPIPDDVLGALVAARAKYPTPLGDQGSALINEVAWLFRSRGAGLEEKTGGNNCPQPKTGIRVACDIFRIGAVGYDVLADQEGEGRVTRAVGGPATKKLIEPVDPGGVATEPDPKPDPEIAALKQQLSQAIADLSALRIAHEDTIRLLDTRDKELAGARAQLNATQAELDALKAKPAPTCVGILSPSWGGRFGFSARCEIR